MGGWNCTSGQKHTFGLPGLWLTAGAVVPGNLDFVPFFANGSDDDPGLVRKSWLLLQLHQSVAGAVDIAVRTAVNAEPAINATAIGAWLVAAHRQPRLAEMDAFAG